MALITGDLLVKRYRIVSRLGRGATGAVYRAYDEKNKRHVAIKTYLDPAPETQKRFRQAVRQLRQLSHPQLPAVLDHFSQNGVGQFLVTEYIDGIDLETAVQQGHPLPSQRIIDWLQAAVKPIAYLHENSQLHLDIKPANIRLTPAGKIYLVDTGLPQLGIQKGKPGYRAPEQAKQREVSVQTDIYALGATLYTLLTAHTPSDPLNRESGLQPLQPAREINPDVEPYLSALASRAMSLNPQARYAHVGQVSNALNRPTGVQAPAAHIPTLRPLVNAADGGRVRPTIPRRQFESRTVTALSMLLLFLIGGALLFGYLNFDPDPETVVEVTATFQSELAGALTQLAPTPTFTPDPTILPTRTPDPIFVDEFDVTMRYIPGGRFRMGRDEGDDDMQPSHRLTLSPYYIDETEVTNRQYRQCVDAGECLLPENLNATYYPNYFNDPIYDEYPVIFVTWYMANNFCQWRGGRLPSEAEWEYAAGYSPTVGEVLQYPWGDIATDTPANYCDLNCLRDYKDLAVDDGYADTAPVGSFPAGQSPFGVQDMAGNVIEWVYDWYDADYYEESSDVNPLGPIEGYARSLRGGSWISPLDELRVSVRGSFVPEVTRANLGFRCTRPPQ